MSDNVKLDDSKWRRILKSVLGYHEPHAKVGVLASSGAGDEHGDTGATNVEIAIFQELGTRFIPARSFLWSTFYVHKVAELHAMVATLAKKVLIGELAMKRALQILGAWGANAVKNTITQSDIPPPLADSTIARKGSTKPLVDTGQLVGSISWEYSEGYKGEE